MNKIKLFVITLASALITICNPTVAHAAPVVIPDGAIVTPVATGPTDFATKRLNVFSGVYAYGQWWDNTFFYIDQDGRQLFTGQIPVVTEADWSEVYTNNVYYGMLIDESAFFDENAYALYNPDVAAMVGTSKEALWNHYKTVGVYEGRLALATREELNAELIAINIAQQITTPEMSDRDKVRAVHDWMCENACYDYYKDRDRYSIKGFMMNHTTVCHGYATTFEFFMAILNIPCDYVRSENHAWNRVLLDGQWYAIDVCWDDPTSTKGPDYKRYTYYLISEEVMNSARSHTPTEYKEYFQSI